MSNNTKLVLMAFALSGVSAMGHAAHLMSESGDNSILDIDNLTDVDLSVLSEESIETINSQVKALFSKKSVRMELSVAIDQIARSYGEGDKSILDQVLDELNLGASSDSSHISTGTPSGTSLTESEVFMGCHAACHGACHNACHGSRGWR